MKLHWSPRSPFVRKVMIVVHELKIADEIQFVRTQVASTEPNSGLLADNPLSKIPTLVLADGQALFDSRVICEYLDVVYGSNRFIPRDSTLRWKALTWQALGDGLLDALLVWRQERTKQTAFRNEKLVSAFGVKLQATLEHLEKQAGALAETEFGIGHVAIGCALSYIVYRFPDIGWRDSRPGLAAWHAAFERRSSVRATMPGEESEAAGGSALPHRS